MPRIKYQTTRDKALTEPKGAISPKHHEVKVMRLADLKPAEYNPRTISKEAAAGLTESLSRFGLVDPLIVNKRTGYTIVGGHQRYAVMQQSGLTEAQVVIVDLSEAEERALNVTLNNPHISGDFSGELASLLDQIRSDNTVDFDAIGLKQLLDDLVLPLKEGKTDADDAPEKPGKPVSKTGDLYLLGDHRLLCGDSSDPESYKTLLGEDRIGFIFTDPPYGVSLGKKNRFLNSFQKSGRNLKDISNDALGKDDLLDLLVKVFTAAKDVSRDDCSYYVTAPQGGELGLMMLNMMAMAGLPTRHVLIWNKNSQNFSMGRLDYEYKHEPILYTWNKSHQFYGRGPMTNSVWDIPKPRKCDVHPTMKPVALVENAILNSSNPGDLVMDMFGGSGTTMIAAERTGRKARLIELDPSYCDVIVRRWEDFTGKKASLSKP